MKDLFNGISKEMFGCLGVVMAAAITGCVTLVIALNPGKIIEGHLSPSDTPVPPTATVVPTDTQPAPTATPEFTPSTEFTATPVQSDYNGTISSIWVDHNVVEGAATGMRIHVNFSLKNLQNVNCWIVAYFINSSGAIVTNPNSAHTLDNGQLAAWDKIFPTDNDAQYSDFTLFMPYDDFALASGSAVYQFYIRVYVADTDQTLAQSNDQSFTLTSNSDTQTSTAIPANTDTSPNNTNSASATINSITPEYDVVENDLKGMNIHIDFNIENLKGINCQAVAYFYDSTGKPLTDTNGKYADNNGGVATYDSFTPGYDSTIYEDFVLFIPYDEFELGSGQYHLEFNIYLYNLNTGETLATSDYYPFDFSK